MTNWIVTFAKTLGEVLFVGTVLVFAGIGLFVGGAVINGGGHIVGLLIGGVLGLVLATSVYGMMFVAFSIDAHLASLVDLQRRALDISVDMKTTAEILFANATPTDRPAQAKVPDSVNIEALESLPLGQSIRVKESMTYRLRNANTVEALEALPIDQSIHVKGSAIYRRRNTTTGQVYFSVDGKEFPDAVSALRHLA